MISVLILTKNEERDLPGCLESVAWCDDVHVFDSYSTDRTVEIARAAEAEVHQRVFDDYATHKNAALTSVAFKHKWVFLLDADERPTAELADEMGAAVQNAAEDVAGFRMRRRDYLFGRWLKHAQISPYYIRLVRPSKARYTRAINEVVEVEGRVAELSAPLDHYPFSKGTAHWVAKHNVYSMMEAELIHKQQGLRNPSWKSALSDPDFHTRRLHQKALFYKMPARPLIKWMYMMFGRGAVLDGIAGMAYATLQSFYEYMIVLKTKELERGGA